MIRIAIVDDEIEQIQKIQKIVFDFFEGQKMHISMNTFTSGEALLSTAVSYDLIFLDIQMNGIDGIETAQQIRDKDRKTTLIYISNFSEKMATSFIVHPFAFLEKPIQPIEIKRHLQDYLEYIESLYDKNMISFPGQHGEITVDIQDILYFEYENNRKIRLIMTDTKYCIIGSISELVKRMEQYDFISPHKSFGSSIINWTENIKPWYNIKNRKGGKGNVRKNKELHRRI